MLVNIYYKSNALLGEGLCVGEQCLYWLDIEVKTLTIKSYLSNYVEVINLPEQASAIWKEENDCVYLASESGLCELNLVTKKWNVMASIGIGTDYRANDGGALFAGGYLFGTMQKQPVSLAGSLYMTDGSQIKEVFKGLGIPNSFISLSESEILISDSLCKKIYKFDFSSISNEIISQSLWLDLQHTDYTPDGGCIDVEGNIYIAMWDGACVNKYNKSAVLLERYSLPALRPTNCKLSKDMKCLFVTTATVGLTKKELTEYPGSGSVLTIRLVD